MPPLKSCPNCGKQFTKSEYENGVHKCQKISEKEIELENIRLAELHLYNMIDKFLKKTGWKESCHFIDSCWRWGKDIDGRPFWTDKRTAFKIERDFIT